MSLRGRRYACSSASGPASRAEVTFGTYAMINSIIAAGPAIWSFTPNALSPGKRLPALTFWLLASAANLTRLGQ